MAINEQTCYNIAEVLVHNKDYLKDSIKLRYIKARHMSREEAILYIIDGIALILADETSFSLGDIDMAMDNEKVRIILDRYYLKEFYYEH